MAGEASKYWLDRLGIVMKMVVIHVPTPASPLQNHVYSMFYQCSVGAYEDYALLGGKCQFSFLLRMHSARLAEDEFDALSEEAISGLADLFRNIYVSRQYEGNKATDEREYLLHAVALIGVRSVLGIENKRGSPFNVQRGLHIPNLIL